MKKIIVPFLLCLSMMACTASKVKKQTILQVNSEEMTVKDFAERLTEKLQGTDLIIAKSTDTIEELKSIIISDFIHSVVTKEWAEVNKIEVSSEEIEQEIQRFRAQYPDDISFRAALAEDNITFERWKENLHQSILERKVIDDVTKNVDQASENEISEHYKKHRSRYTQKKAYRIRQIVLAKSMDAEKLYAQMKRDTNFEKLARDYSIGPEGRDGGDLGWIEEGLAEVFDEAAKLPLKSISKPLKSPFGYHIIQVLERRPTRQLSLAEVKEQIKQEIFEEKKQKAYIAWLDERKSKATVLIDETVLNSMTVELTNE